MNDGEIIQVKDIVKTPPLGFVLSEASVIEIPISVFAQAEVSIREEELVVVWNKEPAGTPIIFGVLRKIHRLGRISGSM